MTVKISPQKRSFVYKIYSGIIFGFLFLLVVCSTCMMASTLSAEIGILPATIPHHTVIITDTMGNTILLPDIPNRIVLQNGRALDLVIAFGAGDRVVGVPDHVTRKRDMMPSIPNAQNIGSDWQSPNVEQILALHPDILLSYTSFRPRNIDQLVATNTTIVYLDCYHVLRLPNESRTLGAILGKEKEAERYAQDLEHHLALIQQRMAQIRENQNTPRVYAELYSDYQAQGGGSAGEEILNLLQTENIAGSVKMNPVVSREWIIEQNPEIIVKFVSTPPNEISDLKAIHDAIVTRPGFSNISAVKNNRVYVIDGDAISSPRGITGVLYLAKAFYPTDFADMDPDAVLEGYNDRFIPAIKARDAFYPEFLPGELSDSPRHT